MRIALAFGLTVALGGAAFGQTAMSGAGADGNVTVPADPMPTEYGDDLDVPDFLR